MEEQKRWLVFYTQQGFPNDWGKITGEDRAYFFTHGGSGRSLNLHYEKGYCSVHASQAAAQSTFDSKLQRSF